MMSKSKVAKAKHGDHVRVEYSGEFKDEKTGVKRLSREICEFTVGSRGVLPGINKGVVGMVEGERKQLTLQPPDAFGVFRPQLIREIPRTRFPTELILKVGKQLTTIGVTSRRRRKVTIVEVRPTTIVVDGNHPLAGKTLEVEFQLLVHDLPSASKATRRGIGDEA